MVLQVGMMNATAFIFLYLSESRYTAFDIPTFLAPHLHFMLSKIFILFFRARHATLNISQY